MVFAAGKLSIEITKTMPGKKCEKLEEEIPAGKKEPGC
jgi:hypothetical protein